MTKKSNGSSIFRKKTDGMNKICVFRKIQSEIKYITGNLPMIGDKLLFILSFLKNNPLQEYHGATFGMTQPQCNEWIHLLSDILVKTLKALGELPDRNSLRMEHVLAGCKNVLLDGTERPIQRPMEEDRQKSCYSGKKNS